MNPKGLERVGMIESRWKKVWEMIRDIGESSVRSFAWKTAHGALWLPPFTPETLEGKMMLVWEISITESCPL